MPGITVIIPVYNVGKYIERCARSLFEQTFGDIEYIFVNDCTPDNSIEILKETMEEYPDRKGQCLILEHPSNEGLPTARKTGILHATGEYIIHCDSDDWIEPDLVETLLEEARGKGADLVLSPLCKEYPDRREILENPVCAPSKEEIIRGMLTEEIHHFLCGSISKRSLYTENGLTYPKANAAEDFALMMQLVFYAGRVSFCDKALYHYIYNPASETGDLSKEKALKRCAQVRENVGLILDFLDSKSILGDFSSEALLLRYSVREQIKAYLNDREVYRLWRSIYPEIERLFLKDKGISAKKKVSYLISYCRLEPYYRPIYKLIHG